LKIFQLQEVFIRDPYGFGRLSEGINGLCSRFLSSALLFRIFQFFFYGIKIVNGGIFGFAFGVFARPAD